MQLTSTFILLALVALRSVTAAPTAFRPIETIDARGLDDSIIQARESYYEILDARGPVTPVLATPVKPVTSVQPVAAVKPVVPVTPLGPGAHTTGSSHPLSSASTPPVNSHLATPHLSGASTTGATGSSNSLTGSLTHPHHDSLHHELKVLRKIEEHDLHHLQKQNLELKEQAQHEHKLLTHLEKKAAAKKLEKQAKKAEKVKKAAAKKLEKQEKQAKKAKEAAAKKLAKEVHDKERKDKDAKKREDKKLKIAKALQDKKDKKDKKDKENVKKQDATVKATPAKTTTSTTNPLTPLGSTKPSTDATLPNQSPAAVNADPDNSSRHPSHFRERRFREGLFRERQREQREQRHWMRQEREFGDRNGYSGY